jgi:hypothetical protein
MKHVLFLIAAVIMIMAPASAIEKNDITWIRDYYTKLLKQIKDGSVYQRDLALAYDVIPGIGATSSRVRIYYDMVDRGEGEYAIAILRIENYYQHAGKALYEECVYDPQGRLVFYYGRIGTGDITRPADIAWNTDERFYFRADRLVRVMEGQVTRDNPGAADLKKGAAILDHARRLRSTDCGIRFPAPMIFSDGSDR